ncbi:MAG: cobalt-precorrin-6A reductase [Polyangiales bacterium]
MGFKVLVLGGTIDGRRLAERLCDDARLEVLLSFAGRTKELRRPALPHRIGGFGGAEGLAAFLRDARFDALIDATHPFAAQMSANAVRAASLTGVPLVRFARTPWQKQPGDRWTEVHDFAAAARALGDAPRRVLLTVGKLELAAFSAAPQHDYLVRTVDVIALGLPRARLLTARGPFALADEHALLVRERIEIIVSKNAGTDATYAKIEAARALGIPVVIVQPPVLPVAHEVGTLDAVCAWVEALHGASPSRRGE